MVIDVRVINYLERIEAKLDSFLAECEREGAQRATGLLASWRGLAGQSMEIITFQDVDGRAKSGQDGQAT